MLLLSAPKCSRSEMDITTVFGTVSGGSNPSESTHQKQTRSHCTPMRAFLFVTMDVKRTPGIRLVLIHQNRNTLVVRVGRIELPTRPWQGRILPLNHTRDLYIVMQATLNIKIFYRSLRYSMTLSDLNHVLMHRY